MKNTITFILLLVVIIATTQSCNEDNTPTDISYNSDISTIISNKCTACHSGNSPSGNLRLTTYSEVKTIAQTGTLMERLNDGNNPMPPTGLLPQENRNTIQEWIDAGFKE